MVTAIQTESLMSVRQRLRTFFIVVNREIRGRARSTPVWTLVLIGMMCAGFSAYLNVTKLSSTEGLTRALHEQRAQDMRRGGGQLTGWQIEPGLRAIRRPNPRVIVVRGVDADLPRYWDFGPSGTRQGPHDVDVFRSFGAGSVDVEFIIRIVFGLLAISLATDTVAGERANGALLALLGQPVQPLFVFLGKITGGTLVLAAGLLAVASTLIVVTAAAGGSYAIDLTFLLTLAAVSMFGLMYSFICLISGVLVGSVVHSYGSAVIATVGLWLCSAVLVLPAATLVAETVSPIASEAQREAEAESLVQAQTRDVQTAMGEKFIEFVGDDWLRIPTESERVRAAYMKIGEQWTVMIAPLYEELNGRREKAASSASRQLTVLHLIAAFSPASQFTFAAADVAYSGSKAAVSWTRATQQHQERLEHALFEARPRLLMLVPKGGHGQATGGQTLVGFNRRPLLTVQSVPPFVAPPSTFMIALRDAAPHVAVMLLYGAVLSMVAARAFNKLLTF